MTHASQKSTQGGARRSGAQQDAPTDGSRSLDGGESESTGLENQNITRPSPPDTSSANEERTRQPASGAAPLGQASTQ